MGRTNKVGKFREWLTKDNLNRIESWARDGLYNCQISENMGITPKTLEVWKKKFPEINEALKRGREVVDFHVENALIKRALGYTTTRYIIDSDGSKKAIQEEVPPDTTACIFWLKNRKTSKWHDRKNVEIEGAVPVVIQDDVTE